MKASRHDRLLAGGRSGLHHVLIQEILKLGATGLVASRVGVRQVVCDIVHIDKDGNFVTADGEMLEPQISIPPDAQSITIATDGTVSFVLPGQTAAQTAGQIQLAGFQNPAGLNSIGRNLFVATDASGEPTVANPGGQEGLGTLLQGYTEQSNVSVVEEFINLIISQRAYEANSKVVKAADEMYQQVNNLTR